MSSLPSNVLFIMRLLTWFPLLPWRIYWAVSVDRHRAERVIRIPVKQDVYCSTFLVGDATEFLHSSPKLHLPHTAYQISVWHLKQTSSPTVRCMGITTIPHTHCTVCWNPSCVWGNLIKNKKKKQVQVIFHSKIKGIKKGII